MTELNPRRWVGAILAAGILGTVWAALSDEWVLLVLFVFISAVQLLIVVRQRANRTPVTLRPDLARWVENRSRTTGEPAEDVLDRALATFKHGLHGEDL